MARAGGHRRSDIRPAGRAARILIAVALLVLGGYAAKQTVALALRERSVDLAYTLAPGDARILGFRSQILAAGAGSAQDWAQATRLARRAVLRDPLSPEAVAVLGMEAGMRGRIGLADRLFAYSAQVSRRDLKTRLWLIERAVERGDVAGALRHYDIALRTSRQAPDVLFPVLQGAISDTNIRHGLAAVMPQASSRIWAVAFVRMVAAAGPDYPAVADLFGRLRARGFLFPEGSEASLLGALVSARHYPVAWAYAARMTPGLSRARSRDPHFRQVRTIPSPFEWNLLDGPGLSSAIQHSDKGGVFTFSAVAGAGGIVLRQFQLLPPGRYTLTSRLAELEPDTPAPFWTVQCVDGPDAARVDLAPGRNGGWSSVRFEIPATCPAQWLNLSVASSDAIGGVEGVIDYAAVAPAGQAKGS